MLGLLLHCSLTFYADCLWPSQHMWLNQCHKLYRILWWLTRITVTVTFSAETKVQFHWKHWSNCKPLLLKEGLLNAPHQSASYINVYTSVFIKVQKLWDFIVWELHWFLVSVDQSFWKRILYTNTLPLCVIQKNIRSEKLLLCRCSDVLSTVCALYYKGVIPYVFCEVFGHSV